MARKNPKVDAYIANAAGFARPILNRIRTQVHAACPDVEETLKWGMPHFVYKGNLCYMAAFTHHCGFGFWRSGLVVGADADGSAAGNFGRIVSVADLPPARKVAAYIKKAAALNDAGVKRPPRARAKVRAPLVIPAYFKAALKVHPKAAAAFKDFSHSHKKEYLEWVTGAKREDTQRRRLAQAVAMMSSGKSRNWKYEERGR
jgi:uncharacterized protein YdeI (YjbR/CyaY-like superfamily)